MLERKCRILWHLVGVATFLKAFWKPVEVSHVKRFGKSVPSRVNESEGQWGGDALGVLNNKKETVRQKHKDGKTKQGHTRSGDTDKSQKRRLVHCSCCCCSVTQSCLTLCYPMDCNPPGLLSLITVRRLVWAGKHQLGNAAWGASFPSERALPAGGFGSVHTPSP